MAMKSSTECRCGRRVVVRGLCVFHAAEAIDRLATAEKSLSHFKGVVHRLESVVQTSSLQLYERGYAACDRSYKRAAGMEC